jgi:hypothetical protein
MSARAKPILSIFAIAAARSSPSAKALGSSTRLDGDEAVCGAGDGEAGAAAVVVVDGTGTGAAGVCVSDDAGAGVDGAGAGALLVDAPGCGLG